MTPSEWDALPWYEQRMYREGFAEEGLVTNHAASPTPTAAPAASSTRPDPSAPVATSRDGAVIRHDYHHDFSNRPGEFAAAGFREQTLHR